MLNPLRARPCQSTYPRRDSGRMLNQFGVVTLGPEEAVEGLVATTKRTVDGAAFAMQARTYKTMNMSVVIDPDA